MYKECYFHALVFLEKATVTYCNKKRLWSSVTVVYTKSFVCWMLTILLTLCTLVYTYKVLDCLSETSTLPVNNCERPLRWLMLLLRTAWYDILTFRLCFDLFRRLALLFCCWPSLLPGHCLLLDLGFLAARNGPLMPHWPDSLRTFLLMVALYFSDEILNDIG